MKYYTSKSSLVLWIILGILIVIGATGYSYYKKSASSMNNIIVRRVESFQPDERDEQVIRRASRRE